jgi:hypothetical protein
MLRLVDRPALFPGKCAVLPNVRANDPGGFIDSGSELDGQRIYVSVRAVKEMAALVGFVHPAQIRALQERADRLEAERDLLQERLDESEAVVEAVNIVKARKTRAREAA